MNLDESNAAKESYLLLSVYVKGVNFESPYPVLLFATRNRLASKLLHCDGNADSITDFLDSHLLQDLLVTIKQVIAIEVVC